MGFFSSLIGPLAGAALGGLTGGKSQTTNTTQKPNYINKEAEKKLEDANLKLITDALNLYQKPVNPAPVTRVGYDNSFGGLFNNPEMQMIQQQEDKKYFDSLVGNPAASTTGNPAVTPNVSDLFIKNDPTGKSWLKQPDGVGVNKSTPGYFSLEDAATMGNQGLGGPMSGINYAVIQELMKTLGKKAVA